MEDNMSVNMPLVSVVLPIYNGEAYLRKSIESVLKQSYTNFELILWNDCATDNSAHIIGQIHDQRIQKHANAVNQGLFPTLNAAIQQTRGSLIRLWAQDDIMKPHCLQSEVDFHLIYPEIAMSYCMVDRIDQEDKVISQSHIDSTPEIVSTLLATQIMFYHGSMSGNISNVMLKKAVLDELNLFRSDMKMAGDLEMWVRITQKYPIGYLKKSLIFLRDHPEQLSRRSDSIVTFIKEEREIYQTLLNRLPVELKSHALNYMRWRRNVLRARYFFRYLASGKFKIAWGIYHEMQKQDNTVFLFIRWLLTMDGKWIPYKPKYVV